MKIAYLLGSLNRGGMETLLLDVFRNTDNAKYDFIGIHRKGGAYQTDFYATGKTMFKLKPKFPFDPVYLWRLRKLLKKEQIQIVHAQQFLDVIYAKIALLGTKIKLIQTFHGFDFGASKNSKRIMRRCAFITDCNIFVSDTQRQYYIKNYQLNPDKQQVVYNGILFSKLDTSVATTTLPTKNELSQTNLKLCMVGNFVRVRDQYTVCEFLKQLKENNITFDFYFIGAESKTEPYQYDNCVQFCKDNSLTDCVHFLGSRNDIPAILKQMDAFIYSTDHDTFGIAVVEALAVGIPVFVNDWSVMSEITENGKYATLYKTKNAQDLSQKFMDFLQNKDSHFQKAKEAAIFVREKYSIEKHIEQLNSMYNTFTQ